MNYTNKDKDELIQELILLKEENCSLSEKLNNIAQVNKKLIESELRYELFFENNHSTMLLIEPDSGKIKDANPSACKYYGWSRT